MHRISTLNVGPLSVVIRGAEPADGTFHVYSKRGNGPETFIGRYATRVAAEVAQHTAAGLVPIAADRRR